MQKHNLLSRSVIMKRYTFINTQNKLGLSSAKHRLSSASWLGWIQLCKTFVVTQFSIMPSLVIIVLKLAELETFPGGMVVQAMWWEWGAGSSKANLAQLGLELGISLAIGEFTVVA
jgi:hypothetical protein